MRLSDMRGWDNVSYKIPTHDEIIEARRQMKIRVNGAIKDFNRPNKYAVAINCSHIGDDNDYSCFLSHVIRKLYEVDKNMAWILFKTDSMVIDSEISFNDFCEHIEQEKTRQMEIDKMHTAHNNQYTD